MLLVQALHDHITQTKINIYKLINIPKASAVIKIDLANVDIKLAEHSSKVR